MCKITFSQIIGDHSLRKGLLQLIDHHDFHQKFSEPSTNPEENESDTVEEIKEKKNELLSNEILEWFKEKAIYMANPEDIVFREV